MPKTKEEMAFAQAFAKFQASFGNELTAKVDRLTDIIGKSHWLSVGLYKESLVKSLLANKVPKRFEVGTGFVLAHEKNTKLLSNQIDILVWDSGTLPPLFRDGDFVIVSPEAVVGAVEVKSTLTSETLQEAMMNLDSLLKFKDIFFKRGKTEGGLPVHRSIFAFKSKLTFPTQLWDHVNDHYRRSKRWQLEDRIKFSLSERPTWSLPWITNVAVLGLGVLNCALVPINDDPQPCYFAYKTEPDKDPIDAYGFTERSILMDLMLGYLKLDERDAFPALTTMLFANAATRVDGKCYMPMLTDPITKLGWGANPLQWQDLIDRNYSPQKVVRRKKRKTKKGASDGNEGPGVPK